MQWYVKYSRPSTCRPTILVLLYRQEQRVSGCTTCLYSRQQLAKMYFQFPFNPWAPRYCSHFIILFSRPTLATKVVYVYRFMNGQMIILNASQKVPQHEFERWYLSFECIIKVEFGIMKKVFLFPFTMIRHLECICNHGMCSTPD